MARDLRRRLDRLERQRQPPGALVRAWRDWLRDLEEVSHRIDPDAPQRSDAELRAQATAEAATGRRPAQAWTEALIAIWQEGQTHLETTRIHDH
jgi:hypothetical protein